MSPVSRLLPLSTALAFYASPPPSALASDPLAGQTPEIACTRLAVSLASARSSTNAVEVLDECGRVRAWTAADGLILLDYHPTLGEIRTPVPGPCNSDLLPTRTTHVDVRFYRVGPDSGGQCWTVADYGDGRRAWMGDFDVSEQIVSGFVTCDPATQGASSRCCTNHAVVRTKCAGQHQ